MTIFNLSSLLPLVVRIHDFYCIEPFPAPLIVSTPPRIINLRNHFQPPSIILTPSPFIRYSRVPIGMFSAEGRGPLLRAKVPLLAYSSRFLVLFMSPCLFHVTQLRKFTNLIPKNSRREAHNLPIS